MALPLTTFFWAFPLVLCCLFPLSWFWDFISFSLWLICWPVLFHRCWQKLQTLGSSFIAWIYYRQHSKQHQHYICMIFFSPLPPQVPRGWHGVGLIAFVHTVSFHDSWDTWCLENSLFYNKQNASLLSAQREAVSYLLGPACRKRSQKWPGIRQGSQAYVPDTWVL